MNLMHVWRSLKVSFVCLLLFLHILVRFIWVQLEVAEKHSQDFRLLVSLNVVSPL